MDGKACTKFLVIAKKKNPRVSEEIQKEVP